MITIQIDGKTYKTMNESIEKTIRSYVWPWCLEEVKENKQSLTLPEMEYKWEREYYRNWIKLEKLKESPSYDEMVSMWMPTELTGCQWVITEHDIGSMGYHQDVENTILRNQEDWKREHGFLSEEDRPEHPKWYLYPETINSYYDTNKTKEWNYQEYQKQLKKAQDEWWAGVKENKEPQFTPWQEEVAQWPHEPCTWNMGNEEATEAIRKSDEYNEKHFPWYKEFKEKNQKESDALFWKPTPWQEIEVSNDGEKWYKYRFSMMSWTAPTIYIVNVDTENWQYACSYRFARPIEDKIEPLPEFDSNHIEWECVYQDRSVRQISLLTIAVNKLIAKQN